MRYVKASGGSIAVGGDLIVNFILEQIPQNYLGAVQRFLDEYMGTEAYFVPFGGRDSELQILTDWVESEQPYCFVCSPVGRGKTALIVHWLNRAKECFADHHVIFAPISIRFNTSSPDVFLEMLVAQLATLLGEQLNVPTARRELFFQSELQRLLRCCSEQDKKILLVLDGLDETSRNVKWDTLFPKGKLKGVKVLLSAREIAGRNSQQWLQAIKWHDEYTLKMDIPLLSESDVFSLVESVLEGATEDLKELAEELYRISEGDPLACNFVLRGLRNFEPITESVQRLRLISEGFAEYFSDWVESLSLYDDVHSEKVEIILAVLAHAFAPMSRADIESVVSLVLGRQVSTLRSTLGRMDRLLLENVEDGTYVLAHPKYRYYLLEEFFADGMLPAACREAYLEWGESILRQLDQGKFLENLVSNYFLDNYRRHLVEHGGSVNHLNLLYDERWCKLQLSSANRHEGYALDMEAAWHVADRAYFEQRIMPVEKYCILALRCAFPLASISSLGTQVPDEVFSMAIDEGTVPVEYVVSKIESKDPRNRLGSYVGVFKHLSEFQQQRVLRQINQLFPEHTRFSYYLRIAAQCSDLKQYCEGKCRSLLDEAVCDEETKIIFQECYGEVDDDLLNTSLRVSLISSFVTQFPDRDLAQEAYSSLETVVEPIEKARLRVVLTKAMSGHLPAEVINEFLGDLQQERDKLRCARCLRDMVVRTPELRTFAVLNYLERLVSPAISVLSSQVGRDMLTNTQYWECYEILLVAKAGQTLLIEDETNLQQQWTQFLQTIEQLPTSDLQRQLCLDILSITDGETFEQGVQMAFRVLSSLPTPNNRVFSFSELAEKLKGHQRYGEAFSKAFEAAEEIGDEHVLCSWNLLRMRCSDDWTQAEEWLGMVSSLLDREHRASLLYSFLQHCPEGELYQQGRGRLLAEIRNLPLDSRVARYGGLIKGGYIQPDTSEYQNVIGEIEELASFVTPSTFSTVSMSLWILPQENREKIADQLLQFLLKKEPELYRQVYGVIGLLRHFSEKQRVVACSNLLRLFSEVAPDRDNVQNALTFYREEPSEKLRDIILAMLPHLTAVQADFVYRDLLEIEGAPFQDDPYKMRGVLLELPVPETERLQYQFSRVDWSLEPGFARLNEYCDLIALLGEDEDQPARSSIDNVLELAQVQGEERLQEVSNLLKKKGISIVKQNMIEKLSLREQENVAVWSDELKRITSRYSLVLFLEKNLGWAEGNQLKEIDKIAQQSFANWN
ncbi:MAG: NACHT domain-containing protein [Desulfovibrionales bacterium]|nr:NACHT domain-containing protein [Desulfovibrionales bacterium]